MSNSDHCIDCGEVGVHLIGMVCRDCYARRSLRWVEKRTAAYAEWFGGAEAGEGAS